MSRLTRTPKKTRRRPWRCNRRATVICRTVSTGRTLLPVHWHDLRPILVWGCLAGGAVSGGGQAQTGASQCRGVAERNVPIRRLMLRIAKRFPKEERPTRKIPGKALRHLSEKGNQTGTGRSGRSGTASSKAVHAADDESRKELGRQIAAASPMHRESRCVGVAN